MEERDGNTHLAPRMMIARAFSLCRRGTFNLSTDGIGSTRTYISVIIASSPEKKIGAIRGIFGLTVGSPNRSNGVKV